VKIAFIDKTVKAQLTQWGVKSATCEKKFFHNINTLKDELTFYKPDAVFINKGSTLNYEAVRLATLPYFKVYFLGDYRLPFPGWAYAFATMCDIVLFTWKDIAVWESLKKMGQRDIFYVHQGINPDVFRPLPEIKKNLDITFGGGFYGVNFSDAAERLKTVEFLQSKYKTLVAGDGWPSHINSVKRMNHFSLNRFHNRARVTVGIHNRVFDRYGIKYGTSNRLYQCMATGVPHIAQYSPGISELFDSDGGYLDWKTHEDLATAIDWLLSNPEAAEKTGEKQRAQIIKYHTTLHAWMRMENIIRRCIRKK
jgi:spore maturation protein CgeB